MSDNLGYNLPKYVQTLNSLNVFVQQVWENNYLKKFNYIVIIF